MDQITQITQVSEEKYLHDQPVRVFAPVNDLISEDEKVIDGELHIRHIDGQFRKVSLKMVTKLFLEARLVAVQADEDEEDEDDDAVCNCPSCTYKRITEALAKPPETLPTQLTVKEYAEEFGIVLQGWSAESLTVKAAALAARKGHPVPNGSLYSLKFAREVLEEVFAPVLRKQ